MWNATEICSDINAIVGLRQVVDFLVFFRLSVCRTRQKFINFSTNENHSRKNDFVAEQFYGNKLFITIVRSQQSFRRHFFQDRDFSNGWPKIWYDERYFEDEMSKSKSRNNNNNKKCQRYRLWIIQRVWVFVSIDWRQLEMWNAFTSFRHRPAIIKWIYSTKEKKSTFHFGMNKAVTFS